jgi:hypothetical protein
MIKESIIEIDESQKINFCRGLRGRIFHGTKAENIALIKKTGSILVNIDSLLSTSYGNSINSFYRQKGCVSVFDYENPTNEKWEEHMWKCDPLGTSDNNEMAFLFLSEEAKKYLFRWEEAKKEWESERVVPHVEAGYKGNIPMSHISEIQVVKIIIDTNGIAYKMRQAINNSIKVKHLRTTL